MLQSIPVSELFNVAHSFVSDEHIETLQRILDRCSSENDFAFLYVLHKKDRDEIEDVGKRESCI